MGRTVKQQDRERARRKKSSLKRHHARMTRGKNRAPILALGDFQKRLKRGLRRLNLTRQKKLTNPYLRTLNAPSKKKRGLFSKIKSFFSRKKGPR